MRSNHPDSPSPQVKTESLSSKSTLWSPTASTSYDLPNTLPVSIQTETPPALPEDMVSSIFGLFGYTALFPPAF